MSAASYPLCTALRRPALGLALLCVAGGGGLPAGAFEFRFPGAATQTVSTPATVSSYGLPTGPWQSGSTPKQRLEGSTRSTAFELDAPSLTSLEILRPLRDQLQAAGYAIIFECDTDDCGGFDFRFDAGILPEPAMHVDLGDFRFLSATRKGPDGTEAIGLMVSRAPGAGYVQVTRITPETRQLPLQPADATAVMADASGTPGAPVGAAVTLSTANNPAAVPDGTALGARLMTGGAIVLAGLEFAPGAAELTEGRYSALADLAEWLKANPDKTIALVGHTDATGGLDGNIGISKRRAAAVRSRLTDVYGIPPAQVEAQGVGYLAPRDTNLTEDGRTNNRRVEAILTSTR